MPVNASPEFAHAEIKFDRATTDNERLAALEEMMSTMPGHKGAESLRSQLRARYKKLKEKMETKGKKSGGGRPTIKKEVMQACIVGFPNSGKSSLFKNLTNQKANISDVPFSTYIATPGMMEYEDVQVQIIDMPPFPNEDKSIINTADTVLIVINNPQEIEDSRQFLQRSIGKKIYIYTKTDTLNETEKRRLEANLKSKYRNIDWVIFSNTAYEKIDLLYLKKKIFETFPVIRVYTKEPKKESTGIPMILDVGSRAKDIAEKINKGMSKKIKKTKIWGPSSKFPGQMIGLDHVLKDKDTIEFQTE